MALKKVTILILPDGVTNVKQVKIPRVFLASLLIFIFVAAGFLAWGSMDYYRIKSQAPEQARLLEENRQKDVQLLALTNKIGKINSKMVELIEFDNKLKIMADLEPGEDNSQFLGIGGPDPALVGSDYSIENAVRLIHQSLDNLDTAISVETEEKNELYKFLENQKSILACRPSIWPAKGWTNDGFGYRTSPFTGKKEFHEGLDISARKGSPVIAPADGYVSKVTKSNSFGNYIEINHGYGYKTRYGHLSKALVKKGQAVKRGEKIALIGSTGRSTGPHLHYEVHRNNIPVDPKIYILD